MEPSKPLPPTPFTLFDFHRLVSKLIAECPEAANVLVTYVILDVAVVPPPADQTGHRLSLEAVVELLSPYMAKFYEELDAKEEAGRKWTELNLQLRSGSTTDDLIKQQAEVAATSTKH